MSKLVSKIELFDTTPLIWTARGNVPVESLRYEKEWLIEMRDNGDTILWFHERWFFGDGELAKNNAHGYVVRKPESGDVTIGLTGAGIGGQQAAIQ